MQTPHNKGTGDGRCRRGHPNAAGWMLLAFLCACGADSKYESRHDVVAKVNGSAITAREWDEQLSRIELRAGADARVGKKQVLDALVDENLLMQKAIEDGLDREPETRAALDRARRHILAQAAIDRATAGGRASYAQTKAFYETHPELFERRKTYVFRRFDLLAGELHASLKAELDRAGSPAEVAAALKRAGVRFSDQTEIRATEMLPPDVLKQAARMQRGDILVFRDARQIVLMQLMAFIADPIDLARASPAIQAYLADSRRRNAAESLLKNLRSSAKIEYSEGLMDGIQVQTDAGAQDFAGGQRNRRSIARVSTTVGFR